MRQQNAEHERGMATQKSKLERFSEVNFADLLEEWPLITSQVLIFAWNRGSSIVIASELNKNRSATSDKKFETKRVSNFKNTRRCEKLNCVNQCEFFQL